MLYHLISYMNFFNSGNTINYLSYFRLLGAAITSFALFFLCGKYFIKIAQNFFKSPNREYTPESHKIKAGTPSMGGIFMILTTIFSIFSWADLIDTNLLLALFCLMSFGAIGLWDDVSKILYKRGISEKAKSFGQVLAAGILVFAWFSLTSPATTVCVPFLPNYCLDIGYFIIPYAIFIIIGTSNAVNLTDGLDGLAIRLILINLITIGYLGYSTITAELTIGIAALVGSCLGFLYYNRYPAQIFMGDVGSLSLGAVLGFLAISTRHELFLPFTGIIFVVETLSVIIQVLWYKAFKQRFFKRAPLHHHFELSGWHEASVTRLFTIITLLLCLLIIFLSTTL